MLNIQINKDIESYNSDVWKGLSGRQIVYGLLTMLIGGGIIIVCTELAAFSLSAAVYMAVPFALPIALQGFVSINHMTMTEIVKRKIQIAFGRPITFESTENEYILIPNKQEKKLKIGFSVVKKKNKRSRRKNGTNQ